jgi:hypothetical protein
MLSIIVCHKINVTHNTGKIANGTNEELKEALYCWYISAFLLFTRET